MNIFYSPEVHGTSIELGEEETRHLQVLRQKPGDEIVMVDGKGGWYQCEIIELAKRSCRLRVVSSTLSDARKPYRVHLAIAPTKNLDRLEWAVEKAVEIGVDEITPLICKRSERVHLRIDRLEKVALSAMKQSLKVFLPKINMATDLSVFLNKQAAENAQKWIAWLATPPAPLLQHATQKGQDAVILIGPEGDFTSEEVDLAQSLGFQPVSLGDSRLRTETAGVTAVHTIALINM